MAETYKNAYLTLEEMTGNAQIILDTMTTFGWSKSAICGMLGNMQSESTINPGIYESLDSSSTTNGFGIVQWTPNTKYINDWAIPRGYTSYDQYGRIAPQCDRIKYELDNGLQWIPTSMYPMSFQEFVTSTESPEHLAQVFIRNYERPADPDQPIRSTQAKYWYDNLEGGGGGVTTVGFIQHIGRTLVAYSNPSNTLFVRMGNNTFKNGN